MNTLAPEFSALIIIFGSTGPVISTRRSWRSGGVGATLHESSSRTDAVSGRNPGSSPASNRVLALGAGGQQLHAARIERPMQVGHEGQRLGRQHLVDVGRIGVGERDAVRQVHALKSRC